jgi:hypothetical protein
MVGGIIGGTIETCGAAWSDGQTNGFWSGVGTYFDGMTRINPVPGVASLYTTIHGAVTGNGWEFAEGIAGMTDDACLIASIVLPAKMGTRARSAERAKAASPRQTMATGNEWYEYLSKKYGPQNVEWISGSGRTVAWPKELPAPVADAQMYKVRPAPRCSSFVSELESVSGPRPTNAIAHHVQPLGLNGLDNGATNGAWVPPNRHRKGHAKLNKQTQRLPYGARVIPRPKQ